MKYTQRTRHEIAPEWFIFISGLTLRALKNYLERTVPDDPLAALDPSIVIEPKREAHAAVIWLHGLGADGHDFEPVVPELTAGKLRTVRFVFPHAPKRPVSINDGMLMRAWYDISEADLSNREDQQGVHTSADILTALVQRETDRGIAAKKIVLAGFSQGGAIALHAGLRFPVPLAGILALSTYLPMPKLLEHQASSANRKTPIFLAHGSQDPVISLSLSESSRVLLNDLGYRVQSHTYPMPHSVCAEEIRDITHWLENVLA